MEINKITIKKFRTEFDEAVAEFSKKHGVVMSLGNISYSANSFSGKLTVESVGDAVDGVGVEEVRFKMNAVRFGFDPLDYNKEVSINGKAHKFVGFKLGARKNTCIIKDSRTGSQYVTDASTIKRNLRNG